MNEIVSFKKGKSDKTIEEVVATLQDINFVEYVDEVRTTLPTLIAPLTMGYILGFWKGELDNIVDRLLGMINQEKIIVPDDQQYIEYHRFLEDYKNEYLPSARVTFWWEDGSETEIRYIRSVSGKMIPVCGWLNGVSFHDVAMKIFCDVNDITLKQLTDTWDVFELTAEQYAAKLKAYIEKQKLEN